MVPERHAGLIEIGYLCRDRARSVWLADVLGAWPDLRVVLRAGGIGELGPRRMACAVFIWDLDTADSPDEAELAEFYRRLPGEPALLVLGNDPAIGSWVAVHPAAWGWVPADTDEDALVSAIEGLASGLVVVHPGLLSDAMPLYAPTPSAPEVALSPRERDILDLAARGLTNRQMADELGISENTVKFHVAGLYDKLGVGNRTEALRAAVRAGWVAL